MERSQKWAVAIVVVVFDESLGQVIQHVHPKDVIPAAMLDDIKMLAMPDCLDTGEHEFTFQARIRNKMGSSPFEALNTFVYFKQSRSAATRRGYEQRSLVLACRHYYSDLSYRILSRLVDVLEALPIYKHALSSTDLDNTQIDCQARDDVGSAIEVCFEHFRQWPDPLSSETMTLPFYGEMLEISVPDIAPYVKPHQKSPSTDLVSIARRPGEMGLGDGTGVVGDINLMSVFSPLGLLPHLWALWELIITGKNIVVYAPSAAICSACVTALASLAAPLSCCADIRPYINNYDSDTTLFAEAAARRGRDCGESCCQASTTEGTHVETHYTVHDSINIHRIKSVQCIVGITNPFLLRTFSQFEAAIFVPDDPAASPADSSPLRNPDIQTDENADLRYGSSLAGYALRALPRFMFSGASSSESLGQDAGSPASSSNVLDASSPRTPPTLYKRKYPAARSSLIRPPASSLETVYDDWCSSGGGGSGKAGRVMSLKSAKKMIGHVLLSFRSLPLTAPDKSILYRLSQFSSHSHNTELLSTCHDISSDDSDAIGVGGLLIREHFKMLTLALLKPFNCFFSPVDYRLNRCSGELFKPSPASPGLSIRRVGASSLWLYADTTTLLGEPNVEEAIRSFISLFQTGNLPPSLGEMGKSNFASLLTDFSKTLTFRVWCSWRRNALISQLRLTMIEISRNISSKELIDAFAIEQRKEVLVPRDLDVLAERIENTIANVRAINSSSLKPITDDNLLCGHMLQHLKYVNELRSRGEPGLKVAFHM